MKNTFKSHGKTYDIKPVGTETKTYKGNVPFGGEEVTYTRPKYGVFDGDQQVGKINGDQSVMINGKKVGSV